MKRRNIFVLVIAGCTLLACKGKEEPTPMGEDSPKLRFSLDFDETLPRLGNFGEEVEVGEGNAAQSPDIKGVSLHYIEFAPDSLTPLNAGAVVYKGAETTAGGPNAVAFDKAPVAGDGELFTTVELSKLPVGTYNWLRVSVTYQNYDIDFRYNDPPYFENTDLTGRLSSFVGFNTYITSHLVKDSLITINDDRVQGYWALETSGSFGGASFGTVQEGEGAGVTVVNPISATSPIPTGSCVVTGKLAEPLIITGNETEDLEIVLAFSVNNSFEWEEVNEDGKFEPAVGETVVDMGLRGLHPYLK